MNKILPIITALLGSLLFLSSCKDRKTYADYLKDERKAIDLFVAQNQLNILNQYPSNGKFGEKDFFKDPETGVYFQVINYGDTTRNLELRQKVYIRYSGLHFFMTDDTTKYSRVDFPESIDFLGPVNNSNKSSYSNPGWVVPLRFVGHNGKVRMIIPFVMGSATDRTQYQPTYYDQIYYRFEGRD